MSEAPESQVQFLIPMKVRTEQYDGWKGKKSSNMLF